jgi:hypothetical protein
VALDFSRNYSPPGVYVEETDSTLVSTVGVPPTIVALVGPARGYRTHTEQIVYSDDAYQLAKQGVDNASVVVTVAATGTVIDDADYVVAKVGTSSAQDYYTNFTGVADPDTVTDGTVVFVTYQYTDPEYYVPKTFKNFEDVKDVFGEPLNTATPVAGQPYENVLSPLSLAASVAIKNGATDLVMVATEPLPGSASSDAAKSTARAAALKTGYNKIAADPAITVIVPVTTGIAEADADTALSDLHAHLAETTNEGLMRFGVIGFDSAVTTAPDALLAASLSATPNRRRVMLAYAAPGAMLMYSGSSNASFVVGHSYLAAGYAGRMQALPVQTALTKQVIIGFTGVAGTPLANSLKNKYASGGVAITEQDRFNRLTVRHGVTADTTSLNTREASVVRARDGMVRALSESTSNSGLIGQGLDDDMLLAVKSNVSGVLESAVADDVIVAYSGLSVRQRPEDPSVVEVKFAYRPTYPLNYIVISFSIDTSTGLTDFNDTADAA